jgi:Mce-associated membrane protein
VTKDDVTTDDVTTDAVTKDAVTKDDETDITPVDDVDGETTDVDAAAGEESTRPRGPVRRLLIPLSLVVLLLASAGVATWAYLSMYRPDQRTDAAVASHVVQAASDGTVSLLSYAPATMDKDFATAKSHLTGDFLNYYTQFTATIVGPAVKTKAVKTSASVVRSALSQLQPTSAEVLLFVNQTTTSKENPDGAFAASSVKVGLTKIGDDWLISTFDPV